MDTSTGASTATGIRANEALPNEISTAYLHKCYLFLLQLSSRNKSLLLGSDAAAGAEVADETEVVHSAIW